MEENKEQVQPEAPLAEAPKANSTPLQTLLEQYQGMLKQTQEEIKNVVQAMNSLESRRQVAARRADQIEGAILATKQAIELTEKKDGISEKNPD